jgi:hypothetical protein
MTFIHVAVVVDGGWGAHTGAPNFLKHFSKADVSSDSLLNRDFAHSKMDLYHFASEDFEFSLIYLERAMGGQYSWVNPWVEGPTHAWANSPA